MVEVKVPDGTTRHSLEERPADIDIPGVPMAVLEVAGCKPVHVVATAEEEVGSNNR